jgi:signal peptide peptidase SppA
MNNISGGSSSYLIEKQFKMALDDPNVESIILNIDSPGGTVDGTSELAELIYNSRGIKPVIAWSDGIIASAAYWIASAADAIFISSETTNIGSIGVIATHTDTSKSDEMEGIKKTEIIAGKYKNAGSPNGPLDENGKAIIQDRVNQIYSVFVETVAKHRDTTFDDVLTNMADGRIFMGSNSIDAGLADGIIGFDDLLKKMATGHKFNSYIGEDMQKVQISTVEELQNHFPELCKTIFSDGLEQGKKELNDSAIAEAEGKGFKNGAESERERIQSIFTKANKYKIEFNKIEEILFDGKTSSIEASEKFLDIISEQKVQRINDLREDAPDALPPVVENSLASQDFETLVSDFQKERNCKRSVALSAVASQFPEVHKQWINKFNKRG